MKYTTNLIILMLAGIAITSIGLSIKPKVLTPDTMKTINFLISRVQELEKEKQALIEDRDSWKADSQTNNIFIDERCVCISWQQHNITDDALPQKQICASENLWLER